MATLREQVTYLQNRCGDLQAQVTIKQNEINRLKEDLQRERAKAVTNWISAVAQLNSSIAMALDNGINRPS